MPYQTNLSANPRILIVDDESFMRVLFTNTLQNAGLSTTVAHDGSSALACVSETHYDLIILDLIMPDIDGFVTCKQIRAIPSYKLTPILMVTGRDDSESIHRAFEAGASDFVTKPIIPELLIHRVQYLLRSHRNVRELAESETRLTSAQRTARIGNWEWFTTSGIFRGSQETFKILDLDRNHQHITLRSFLALVHPQDRILVSHAIRHAGRNYEVRSLEYRLICRDKSQKVVRMQLNIEDGEVVTPAKAAIVTGTIQDITEMRQTEDRLRILKEAVGFLPIGVGITISDTTGKIIYSNPVDAAMHGFTPEELIGRHASIFAPPNQKKLLSPEEMRVLGRWTRESINVRKNGEEFPVQLSSIAVHDDAGRCIGVVTACEDISRRIDAEKRIEHLAYYDTLTGLPNRVTLLERLQQALALAQREGRRIGLMFLDLDNFKDVNDTLGHDFGDKLLKEVAERLGPCMRESDTLARLGGDEFVVALTFISSAENAASTSRRILSQFSHPFIIDDRHIYTSASIGIAIYPDDGLDVETLLRSADAAMYHAKSEGRSFYRFFSSELNQRITRRVALEHSLHHGLEHQEFYLHYQPQWDLQTGGLIGVEALLRWKSAEFGPVQPSEFIPLAEISGLIFALGEWVLRSACVQARSWAEAGHSQLRVAVNISGKQFKQPDFLEMVSRVFSETGVNPCSLEFEFTESVIMEKADKNIKTLTALKDMGVKLSIDDFGTGYSSLNYLKHFPIDRIKIDRSFISDINCDTDGETIVETIISMAHNLNLKVVAEGVEDGDQLKFLMERKCDEVQGFYLGVDMPVATLESILGNSSDKITTTSPQ
jgi:diguanylate cyclase (GGDEF)-like protein/PAS domain S-box-containing protein